MTTREDQPCLRGGDSMNATRERAVREALVRARAVLNSCRLVFSSQGLGGPGALEEDCGGAIRLIDAALAATPEPEAGGERQRKQEDLDMMREPEKWPSWPFLPLKKYTGVSRMETGVLYDKYDTLGQDAPQLFFYGANLWNMSNITQDQAVLRTPQQLIDEGWMVD